jgi:predicted acyltransferase
VTHVLASAVTTERKPEAPTRDATSSEPAGAGRLSWLDQYRGYTVLGMFVVNFIGSFHAVPAVLKHHHTYCSYADTIMPQFLFAVGFAYRMTFLRRLASSGWWGAIWHAIQRNLALILVGFIVYKLGSGVKSWADITGGAVWTALGHGLKRDLFQTLVHIGVTSLWVLPVIGAGVWTRVAFTAGSAVLHFVLSCVWYYDWVLTPPVGIDGGPLGFLTWTVPLLVGSLAYDALSSRRLPWSWLLLPAAGLMLLGYGLSCLQRITPPNDGSLADPASLLATAPLASPSAEQLKQMNAQKNIWTMSQRAGSLTYLTFAAGFALAVAVLFLWLDERRQWRWGVFETLGRNALAGYILHGWISDAIKPYTPRDAPLWYVVAALALFLFLCWLVLRSLEKQRLFLRL